MKSHILSKQSPKGFSIVEVAVAMGVVTLMLTTFLGIFGPAQKSVQRALSTKDANALKDALNNEMAVLREADRTALSVDTSFGKAVNYIIESHDETSAILIYRYKAEPIDDDTDGILPAFTGTDGIPGRDYVVQTAVRKIGIDDARIEDELDPQSVDGPVFVVTMTQLINDGTGGDLTLSDNVSALRDPESGAEVSTEDYDDAVIAFRADFYQLPSNSYNFVDSGNWDFDSVGAPVVSVNIASRR